MRISKTIDNLQDLRAIRIWISNHLNLMNEEDYEEYSSDINGLNRSNLCHEILNLFLIIGQPSNF
jgi:hypothetical protein